MSLASSRRGQRRALHIALIANGSFLIVEAVGGVVLGSLALLADAAHMLSDVAALGIALVAQRLTERPATVKHTFGLQRAEIVGAQANGVLLLAATGWIIYEAAGRLHQPSDISGAGLLLIAAGGLVVNGVSAVVLARAAGASLNMRGALLHMLMDAAGSIGVMAAGIAILVAGATWVDAAVSLLIAALVLWSAWKLLGEATHVLMEGTPRGIDVDEVERFIADDEVVEDVHHVHVWNLASDVPALSAHVVIAGDVTLHDAQVEGDRIRRRVIDRFGIEHTTFELECHACGEPPEASRS